MLSPPVSDIRSTFTCSPKFKTDIWDVFNDKPDWNARGWPDLVRINDLVKSIVDKFELFDKTNKKVPPELGKYLYNLEVVQEHLGALETQTLSQTSRKAEFDEIIANINKMLAPLMTQGVTLGLTNFEGSKILSETQKEQLAEWFGSPWVLGYQASRDGWKSDDFHRCCDNKGKSITVVATANNTFGGYTTTPWSSNGRPLADTKACLFTLKNRLGVPPTRFPIAKHNYAIYCRPTTGPAFGTTDLLILDDPRVLHQGGDFNAYHDAVGQGHSIFDDASNRTGYTPVEVEVFLAQ